MSKIAQFFFILSTHIKLYHWHTGSYARHIASDGLYATSIAIMDKFMEIYQGKYGKNIVSVKMDIEVLGDDDFVNFLKESKRYLTDELNSVLDATKDSDLLNIRDELLGEINKTIYLCSLK